MTHRIAWITLASLLAIGSLVRAAEPLPSEMLAEPVVPLEAFTDEAGFFQRWERDHELRDAQEPNGIVTDRPSFTYSDTTVPRGWMQLESGFVYLSDAWSPSKLKAFAVPELTLRVGLTNWLEFRAVWAGTVLRSNGGFPHYDYYFTYYDRSPTWMTNPQVGFKFQITRNRGWIPQSALIATVFLPIGDGWSLPVPSNLLNYNNYAAPLLDYVFTWSFSERVSLGGSIGGVFDSRDSFSVTQYFQSIIAHYHYSPRLSLFFESYAIFGHQRQYYSGPTGFYGSYSGSYSYSSTYYKYKSYSVPYLDTGVLWRPTKNTQFDWRIGVGLNDYANDFFTGAGFSVRY